MEFKTLSIIKHPPKLVWDTMRDHFPNIADLVDEVESITVQSREKIPSGKLKIESIWKAAPQLPSIIVNYIKPEMLTWTDIAVWDEQNMICNWTIDSHYFKEKMDCKGYTKFDSAIGGRGCRMTFEGAIFWDGGVPLALGAMDGMVSKALESIMSKMVPNNFQKLTTAVAAFIEKQTV
jgi:hypothetical protein